MWCRYEVYLVGKIPISISPTVVGFNGTAAQSLLIAPSNPLFLKEAHMQRSDCVYVCVCRTVLSVPSHTPVVTVILGSKIGPVARQPCRPRSWPISILHLEERGLRSLRRSQVDQKKRKWLTSSVPRATVQKPNSKYSCFLRNTHCFFLVVYILPCFAEFMLVFLINTHINTVHPGYQETTPLRF